MHQVLFHIPFTQSLVPPDGAPLSGFGAMLFLTFFLTDMLWGPRRAQKVGMPRERFQDLGIVLFISGIAGARIVYMLQFPQYFPDKSVKGMLLSFLQIWNGGIVFYGSVIGGVLGYAVFHYFVIRRLRVSTWRLADAVAPLIALGLAVGRIGCYLNGCCWGQVAVEECQTVPLSATLGEFPLLGAHAREQVVMPAKPGDRMPKIHGLQTAAGYTLAPRDGLGRLSPTDQRTVSAVEPGSAAAKAGLLPGDVVVKFNGKSNDTMLDIAPHGFRGGDKNDVAAAITLAQKHGGAPVPNGTRVVFPGGAGYPAAVKAIQDAMLPVHLSGGDALSETIHDWPRGKDSLELEVQRSGAIVPLTFTPRTVPFFPTQVYETVSALLMLFLLLAFQPFRRHHGQVMVLLMVCYAAHRFLNEALRTEPSYALGLTLSQWISVGIFAGAVGLELYLRKTQPKLGPGLHSLSGEKIFTTEGTENTEKKPV